MAVRYIGIPTSGNIGPKAGRGTIVAAASGGTLTGSQDVQIVFDDSVYGTTQEGKQRLIAAVRAIVDDLEVARVWPITSST